MTFAVCTVVLLLVAMLAPPSISLRAAHLEVRIVEGFTATFAAREIDQPPTSPTVTSA
jgi:hypothetical protein